MKPYQKMSQEELVKEQMHLEQEYKDYQKKGLSLDMSRGKPAQDQLELSMEMLDIFHSKSDLILEDGTDCRNYGVFTGIPEARRLVAQMLGCEAKQVIVLGNSSLSIMYDTISRSMTHGIMGNTPWCKLDKVKFLCPVPGYDRHFGVTEHFGIEMISIPLLEDGPDMDQVETLVKEDDSIKGIWCIPKYSNPSGITFSEQVVKRFARLKPKALDFRIYWDNAYMVHDLDQENKDQLLNILEECEKANNPDLVFEFCSTSKVSFAGSGISAFAASEANIQDFVGHLSMQTIGHDKINQLRHVKFFHDLDGVTAHMNKHADLIRPKFQVVLEALDKEIKSLDIGSWYEPKGGYFICYHGMKGTAKAIVKKAKEAGMIMTPAGAPFPYGIDPEDSVIRIAPTYPSAEELKVAVELFVVCIKLATVELLLDSNLK